MIVVWHFLTMRRVCLQFLIVVFPDHTHLLVLRFTYRHCHKLFVEKYLLTILIFAIQNSNGLFANYSFRYLLNKAVSLTINKDRGPSDGSYTS